MCDSDFGKLLVYCYLDPILHKNTKIGFLAICSRLNLILTGLLFFTPIENNELLTLITSLKETSPGWDNVTTTLIKSAKHVIINQLTHIFNLSLKQGTFPAELKIARVVPIFKNGDKSNISNFRPVSVLPVFSKLLEKIVYNRLTSFINTNDILYKYQFGFRPNHSTNIAHITLIDRIMKLLDTGDVVLGVFLDFSKAFDTVNHDILLRKLYKYGVRGIPHQWFTSYLENRKQYVSFNDVSSSYLSINCGVPQGSILGPILFLLYINDIVNVSDSLFTILFADDSSIFVHGKNPEELVKLINNELQNLVVWLNANKLSLNVDKTNYMFFSLSNQKLCYSSNVMINGVTVTKVSHIQFLGIIIDSHLKWKNHVQYIRSKISKGLGILCKARKLLQRSTLITLYYSFIYPYLTYCIEIWGSANSTVLSSLFKVQKRAIRVITVSPFNTHTHSLFQDLKILTLDKIYTYFLGLFMYKVNNNLVPPIFKSFVSHNSEIHYHNTRQSQLLHVPLCNSTAFNKCVSFNGIKLWNLIMCQFRLNVDISLSHFKYMLKQKLYRGDIECEHGVN